MMDCVNLLRGCARGTHADADSNQDPCVSALAPGYPLTVTSNSKHCSSSFILNHLGVYGLGFIHACMHDIRSCMHPSQGMSEPWVRRPVVLPDYAELELRIPEDARCPAWVCFDGKQRQELQRGDAVRVGALQ